jgi:hypothetical protein
MKTKLYGVDRDELRDELWDAMIGRQDYDTSVSDYADACVTRLEQIGALRGPIPTPWIVAGSIAIGSLLTCAIAYLIAAFVL